MKRLSLILLLALFCSGVLFSMQPTSIVTQDVEDVEINGEKKKVKIDVDAVQWEKDKADALEAELEALKGVYKVKVCHFRGMAKIKFNPEKISLDDFTTVIEEEGYAYSVR